MKKIIVLVLFVLLFSFGCGGRRIIVMVPQAPVPDGSPTSPNSTGRKQSEKVKKILAKAAKKEAEAQKKLWVAKVWSGLECEDSVLGRIAWGKVRVALRVKLKNTLLSAFSQDKAILGIFNPKPYPVDIYDERGLVVKNLCPHGFVSIRRQLDVFVGDGNYLNVAWKAMAMVNGVVYTDESPIFYLSSRNHNNRTLQIGTWELNLHPSRGRKRRY